MIHYRVKIDTNENDLEGWAKAHGCINEEWVQETLREKPEVIGLVCFHAVSYWADKYMGTKRPAKNWEKEELDKRLVNHYFDLINQLELRGLGEVSDNVSEAMAKVFDDMPGVQSDRKLRTDYKNDIIELLAVDNQLDQKLATKIATGIVSL